MEELELHAAFFERLVHRREDGVAHASAHLPENCAVVGQAHSENRAQRWGSCKVGGLVKRLGITAIKGKHKVINAAQQRVACQAAGHRQGTVFLEPAAKFVIEAIELRAVECPGLEQAAKDGQAGVEQQQVTQAWQIMAGFLPKFVAYPVLQFRHDRGNFQMYQRVVRIDLIGKRFDALFKQGQGGKTGPHRQILKVHLDRLHRLAQPLTQAGMVRG